MKEAFEDLITFEAECGNGLPAENPGEIELETLALRKELIKEEFNETIEAIDNAGVELITEDKIAPATLAKIADGALDLTWVCLGTLHNLGVDPVPIWEEIKRTNMAKFGPGSWRREDGKLMKPPGWTPPDVAGLISKQRSLSEIYGEHADG